MLSNNWLAALITLALCLLWLRIMDFFAHRGWIESRLSRKLIHMGTGPLFVICWLLFNDSPDAPWLAALVPLAITVQFFLIGIGKIKDDASVKAMSRTGNPREILRGPLYYGIVFVLVTIFYWKSSPIGITALMLLCGGDGLADVLGRNLPGPKLPWNERKSWIGSFGMFAGGWVFSALILALFVYLGIFAGPFSAMLLPITIIAFAGTLVETLPTPDVDNLTVTFTALLLGHFLF